MVIKSRIENGRVNNPNMRKMPPTASLNAAIHAKKTGNKAKIPPYSATSFGNQKDTSNKCRLLSFGDQGNPNLDAPKSVVKK